MQQIYRVIFISLVILMVLWLVDVFIVTANDTEAEVVTQTRLSEELAEAMDLPDQRVQIQHIELPEPPAFDVNNAQDTNVDAEGNKQVSEVASSVLINSTPLQKSVDIASATTQQIQSNYHALSELEPSQLSFLLPQDARERSAFLRYMYVCQNMQFGAVITSDLQTNLMLLKEKRDIPKSDLLRVAQGQLSSQESRLLSAYAPNGIPVRIFPKAIDMELSRYISMAIGQEPLKQLSAVYALTGKSLYLRDVTINNRQQQGSWKLSGSKCIA